MIIIIITIIIPSPGFKVPTKPIVQTNEACLIPACRKPASRSQQLTAISIFTSIQQSACNAELNFLIILCQEKNQKWKKKKKKKKIEKSSKKKILPMEKKISNPTGTTPAHTPSVDLRNFLNKFFKSTSISQQQQQQNRTQWNKTNQLFSLVPPALFPLLFHHLYTL
jgi:hypothetical protein